jgi:hypothetical protein
VELDDSRAVADAALRALRDLLGERGVALAERAGRKRDLASGHVLDDRVGAREVLPLRAEDRVGAQRIAVPPHAVQRIAERARERRGEVGDGSRCRRVLDQHELRAL